MNKRFLISCIALSLLFSSVSYPMAKYFSKESLKKGIDKGSKVLQLAISPGLIWAYCMCLPNLTNKLKEDGSREIAAHKMFLSNHLGTSEAENFEKQIPLNNNLIRKALKYVGYKNWQTVELIPGPTFHAIKFLDKEFIIYDHCLVSKAYKEENKNFLQKKNTDTYKEVVGLLSHEAVHLTNNHAEKEFLFGLSLPLFTHLLSKKLIKEKKFERVALRSSLRVATGISNLLMNGLALWGYRYFAEKEADEGVINDPEILEATARAFRKDAAYKNSDTIAEILDTHRNPLKRAQRFEERAAQLREKMQI